MGKNSDIKIKTEDELTMMNNVIDTYEKELADLKTQRCKLLSKMKHIDISCVIECIENSGISTEEVVQIITAAAKNKKKSPAPLACSPAVQPG